MLNTIRFVLYFLIINLCLLSVSKAQDTKAEYYFGGINFNTGKILPHSPRVKNITGDVYTVQLKIYHQLFNNDSWENPFRATKFGYSLNYIHTENPVIGDIWGANLFLEPILFNFKPVKFYTHLGAGIAYATEKFNKESNPTNFMISTDLSFFFNAKFMLDYQISKDFTLGLNAGFSHCSNAALYLPNLGINIFNYGLNLGYRVFDNEKPSISNKLKETDKKWAYDIALGFATRGVNEEINKYYFIFTNDYSINRLLSRKNIVSLNFHYVLRQGDIYDPYYDSNYYHNFGLALGHELLIRKLSLITQLGAYVYDTHLNKHYWYARLGLRYYITKNIFVMATLTNRTKSADYLQYAVGYRFR